MHVLPTEVYVHIFISVRALLDLNLLLWESVTNPWAKTSFALSRNALHLFPHGFGKFCIQVDFSSFVPLQLAAPFFSKNILLPPQPITFPLRPVSARQWLEWWILILPISPMGPAPSLPAGVLFICREMRHEGSHSEWAVSPAGLKHNWGARKGWSG